MTISIRNNSDNLLAQSVKGKARPRKADCVRIQYHTCSVLRTPTENNRARSNTWSSRFIIEQTVLTWSASQTADKINARTIHSNLILIMCQRNLDRVIGMGINFEWSLTYMNTYEYHLPSLRVFWINHVK